MLAKTKADLKDRIWARFDDATAHAENAITKVAKAAADGKPTIAAVRNNRSHEAARKRLLEIADLTAEAVSVLRRAVFADAATGWRKALDPSLLRESPHIAGMVAAAAEELVDGRRVADDCKIQAARAGDDLERVLVLVSSRGTTGTAGADLLKNWGDRWLHNLLSHAEGLLEDAAYRCDYLAGRAVCKPGLLHPDPTIPWE